jgi:hypothetical protein
MTASAALKSLGLLLSIMAAAGCASLSGPGDGTGVRLESPERQIIVAVHDERAGVQARAGSVSRPYGGGIAYRASLQSRQRMARLAKQHELRAVASWPIAMADLYCVVFEIPKGQSRDAMLASIAAEPGVVLAQPMQLFSTLGERPLHAAAGLAASAAGREVRHAHQWATGLGVKVALIDTGLDSGHPALEGRVISTLDFVGSHGIPSAEEPHGLAVAGVIAAGASAEAGMVGVAPRARLLALRACWHTDPVNAVCNSLTLARAIAAAVDRGADVVNLSLTGPPDPLLERLLERAIGRNILVIGALPENGADGGAATRAAHFPTSMPGVIAVRTAEDSGNPFAGAVPAPGLGILTLRPGGGYDFASGSSLAAAHVSGLVALLRERRAQMGADEVRSLLAEHVQPVALDDLRSVQVVNACRVIASLVEGHCPPAMTAAIARDD